MRERERERERYVVKEDINYIVGINLKYSNNQLQDEGVREGDWRDERGRREKIGGMRGK